MVEWGEVPCLDRNGVIIDYAVTAKSSGGMEVTAAADIANRRATISNLSPSTQYTISVAAVNSIDSGPTTDIIVNTAGLWCAQSSHNIIHFSPEGLSISDISSTTTSISISRTLAEGVVASSYTISYSNTKCFPSDSNTMSGISGSQTMYTLDHLEEGTEYSITITATLTGGGSQEVSTTATTVAIGLSPSHFHVCSFTLF